MIAKLSVLATVMAMAMAAPTTSSAAVAPTSTNAATKPLATPILNLSSFNGQFQNQYPPFDAIPPTDTPLVKQWMAELNLTGVPNLPVVPFTSNGDPKNPNAVPADACDWTVTNCINKDLTVCPKGAWGLTFDDGPTQYSPKLYDFLDTTQQKATLFYIGGNVVQYWQSALRACQSGHQLAVHTWSHHPSTSLTNEQFVAEVKYTELAIKEVCGVTTRYFRPPYGDVDNRIRGLLDAMGYTNVIWDYDTDDWQMPPGGSRTESQVDADFSKWIAAAPNDTTGHIVLEHELYQTTVDAAIKNLPNVQKTWKTVPVAACMNDPHPYREQNITLATLDGKYTTGISSGNSSVNPTPSGSQNSSSSASEGKPPVTTTGTNGAMTTAGQRIGSLGLTTVLLSAVLAMVL
ncbi:chitin deacetylase [Actinomortierella ambigua]|nr:chitin deacetylase [Actinomortierella ambigua]